MAAATTAPAAAAAVCEEDAQGELAGGFLTPDVQAARPVTSSLCCSLPGWRGAAVQDGGSANWQSDHLARLRLARRQLYGSTVASFGRGARAGRR